MSQLADYFRPVKKSADDSLPFITRPAGDKNFAIFTSEQDSFAAFIHQNVRDEISQATHKAAPNETIGLLAGRIFRDERGPYTLVLAAHGARYNEVEATPSHVRISAVGQLQVRRRLESSAYGLDIIGWYHSHPRYQARFSSVDITEQSTWRDPNHIGVVISGTDSLEPLGVYRGPRSSLLSRNELPIPVPISRDENPVQPEVSLITPPDSEVRAELAPDVFAVNRANAFQSHGMVSNISNRFLLAALTVGFICILLSVIWLEQRTTNLETRMANSRPDKDSAGSSPPQKAPATSSRSSVEQRTTQKEAGPTDNLITGDNPVTKGHPLIPSKATPRKRTTKPKTTSKTTSKTTARDASRLTSVPNDRSSDDPTKNSGASSLPNEVKQQKAPGSSPRSQSDATVDKSAKP